LSEVIEAVQGLVDRLVHTGRSPHADTGDNGATPAAQGDHGLTSVQAGQSLSFAGDKLRVVFGYTLRVGEDGVSADPFGDVPERRRQTAPGVSAEPPQPAIRQPIIDIFEEPDAIIVVAELPGADPAGIVCRVEAGSLLIEATGPRLYRKALPLPQVVQAGDLEHSFRNGILEVRIARLAAS
jgi:HSP20 family molecular chaperone IbpA